MEGPTEPIFLPFMCHLRGVKIIVAPDFTISGFNLLSVLMHSLHLSLTLPTTLEHLELAIWFHYPDNYLPFLENLGDTDAWRHLDSIIAHQTGTRLQRVDIYIKVDSDDDDLYFYNKELNPDELDGILQAVKGGLPSLWEKGILFVNRSQE
jgi:hypothetical protein